MEKLKLRDTNIFAQSAILSKLVEFKLESWSFDSKLLSFFVQYFFVCEKHSPLYLL